MTPGHAPRPDNKEPIVRTALTTR